MHACDKFFLLINYLLTLSFLWIDIPGGVSEQELKEVLEESFDVGDVKVERSGSCSSYNWKVKWLTKGGNQPELVVNGSGLTGNQPSVSTKTISDGNLFLGPIPGEFLRMPSTEPEVRTPFPLLLSYYRHKT